MKKFRFFVFLLVVAASLSSCTPSSRKAAAKAAEKAWKEYRKVSQNEGVRYLKSRNNLQQIENAYKKINVCGTCDGWGIVYHLDQYGNIITDIYGNAQLYTCDDCGGDGKRF